MEAVKQGSACVGLRSRDFVVLAALKRQQSELSSYQQKIFCVDDHMGIAVAGLIADARTLHKYMLEGELVLLCWCILCTILSLLGEGGGL